MGEQALALCGLAAQVLGWRPAEFWAATPAELAAALGLCGPADAGAPSLVDRAALERIFGASFEDVRR